MSPIVVSRRAVAGTVAFVVAQSKGKATTEPGRSPVTEKTLDFVTRYRPWVDKVLASLRAKADAAKAEFQSAKPEDAKKYAKLRAASAKRQLALFFAMQFEQNWVLGKRLMHDQLAHRFERLIDDIPAKITNKNPGKAALRRARVVRAVILSLRMDEGLCIMSRRCEHAPELEAEGSGKAKKVGSRLPLSDDEVIEFVRADRVQSLRSFRTSCEKRRQMLVSTPWLSQHVLEDRRIVGLLAEFSG